MLVVLCPGQGSQTPGFLEPWLELDSFASVVSSLSEASGLDIAKHGTESDAETIRDTAVAQPLIVAASIASALELGPGFSAVAGHSVGEFAAAALAGILTPEDAIRAVSVRSRAMASAAALEPTSMAAVLGGEQSVVLERLEQLDLYPANFNGAGQIVAAGNAEAIAALVTEGPAGARVIQLQVAGAFHTRYMEPAVAELAGFAAGLETGIRLDVSGLTKPVKKSPMAESTSTFWLARWLALFAGMLACSHSPTPESPPCSKFHPPAPWQAWPNVHYPV